MIKVFGSKVVVAPIENPDMIGSFYIPDIAKERLNQGFVKYRGPKTKNLKIGDYVLFSGYTGTLVHIEGEGKLIILPERFCTALIEFNVTKAIPGIFFKDRMSHVQNRGNLLLRIKDIMPDLDDDLAVDLAMKLDRVGVIDEMNSPYYVATYEVAMQHIASAFSEDKEWRDAIKIVSKHPALADITQEERMSYVTEEDDDDDEDDAS